MKNILTYVIALLITTATVGCGNLKPSTKEAYLEGFIRAVMAGKADAYADDTPTECEQLGITKQMKRARFAASQDRFGSISDLESIEVKEVPLDGFTIRILDVQSYEVTINKKNGIPPAKFKMNVYGKDKNWNMGC